MNRRAFLAAVFGVPMTAKTVTAAPSVHEEGTLVPLDNGDEGYYGLCAESGRCHAIETLGISVHPNNPFFADDLKAMAHMRVQVSIFPVKS